jgi:hypothetical protein
MILGLVEHNDVAAGRKQSHHQDHAALLAE